MDTLHFTRRLQVTGIQALHLEEAISLLRKSGRSPKTPIHPLVPTGLCDCFAITLRESPLRAQAHQADNRDRHNYTKIKN